MAEGNVQQSTSESSSERRVDTMEIHEIQTVPENSKEESRRKEREKKIDKLRKEIENGKEKTIQGIKELKKSVELVESIDKIIKDAEIEKEKCLSKKTASVTFAIKAANKERDIETQIIDYIKRQIPKEKLEMKTTFDWENRQPASPLVVFCNYSSGIGVDVQVSLRGVQEPKVILIILHYIRRALIKGDLSDDDYLLPDNLKERTVCIAHFAFDSELYDCKQNRWSRDKLCNDLDSHYKIASKENASKEVSAVGRFMNVFMH